MKKIYFALLVLFVLTISCTKEVYKDIDINKPHWDADDYEAAVREIQFSTPEGEKIPNLVTHSDIFKKLIDQENISAILDDNALGLKYRSEFAEKMFQIYKNLDNMYSVLDRQDKFIYPVELAKIDEWGLFIQLRYFKLGNDAILKSATDPEENNVKVTIKNNEQTIIGNFGTIIDSLVKEDALSTEATTEYSSVIDNYFTQLLSKFPNGNYSEMLESVKDVLKKIKTPSLRKSLEGLKVLIETQQKKKSSETPEIYNPDANQ